MELVNLIKKKFEDTPSDLDGIRELLAQRKFTAEELAEIAVFLMSNASKCVSGEIIPCNQANHYK